MKLARPLLASFAALLFAATAHAKEVGHFLVRLGTDTTAVESYTRTDAQVDVDQVGRAPRVLRRHFVYDLTKGHLSHFSMVVTAPGATAPTQTIEVGFAGDSMMMKIKTGTNEPRDVHMAWPAGTLALALSSPWVVYEGQTMKLARSKSDSLTAPLYYLGGDGIGWLRLSRLGRDSVAIINSHDDVFHAQVDKEGRLLGVLPVAGTGKFSVQRMKELDTDAYLTSFAAEEKQGAGLGTLSPRDTVNVSNAGGATLWIDYGRPGKRGRVIFGDVVPYGAVWRTGANAATQFKTDKALNFGGILVPAGFYTLWTIPTAAGWKLVINSETGQWGTAHNAAKDLYTIDMKVSTLPQSSERFTISVETNAQGGALNLDWDTTRASAAFTTQP